MTSRCLAFICKDEELRNNRSGLNILPSYTDYFELDTVTLALQSSMSWAGCAVAGLGYGKLTAWVGRKKAMWISAVITLIGIILQTAAQNIAMFVVARFIVGIGNGATFICGPIYLAEIFPLKWRGIGLAIFMDFFYVGMKHYAPSFSLFTLSH